LTSDLGGTGGTNSLGLFKKISIGIGCVLSILILLFLCLYASNQKRLFWSTGTSEKAFLNATWEMSPQEISRANNAHLTVPELDILSIPFEGDDIPSVLNMKRYKTLEQKDLTIWGETAVVDYGFFDDRLFTYTVFIEDYNLDELNENIVKEISKRYGQFIKKDHANNYLFYGEWHSDKIAISTWLWKEKDQNYYKAGVQFNYKPFIEKIRQINLKEKEKLF
jgi:hypothetical protein